LKYDRQRLHFSLNLIDMEFLTDTANGQFSFTTVHPV